MTDTPPTGKYLRAVRNLTLLGAVLGMCFGILLGMLLGLVAG